MGFVLRCEHFCVEDEVVCTVVLGSVVIESGWEEDVVGLLVGWHSCVPSVRGPKLLVVDEVSDLWAGLASATVQGSPLVVTPVDLDWQHNLIQGVSYKSFYGVEAYGVVGFLRLRMESARTAKVMGKFPAMNAVNMNLFFFVRWGECLRRLISFWVEIG